MRKCSCIEITEIIILKDQREQWLSILTSLTKGEFNLRLKNDHVGSIRT